MITFRADDEFGDQNLGRLILFGWDDVIGETRAASEWVCPGDRTSMIRRAKVTAGKANDFTVVVYAHSMKEEWRLATSVAASSTSEVAAC